MYKINHSFIIAIIASSFFLIHWINSCKTNNKKLDINTIGLSEDWNVKSHFPYKYYDLKQLRLEFLLRLSMTLKKNLFFKKTF